MAEHLVALQGQGGAFCWRVTIRKVQRVDCAAGAAAGVRLADSLVVEHHDLAIGGVF